MSRLLKGLSEVNEKFSKNQPSRAEKSLLIIFVLCDSLAIEKFAVVVTKKILLSPTEQGLFLGKGVLEMTKGEAKQLENNVIIFPMDNEEDNREILLTKKPEPDDSIVKKSVKSSLDDRFARLKRSLRKRSASIL
jgi:hypothetical protein